MQNGALHIAPFQRIFIIGHLKPKKELCFKHHLSSDTSDFVIVQSQPVNCVSHYMVFGLCRYKLIFMYVLVGLWSKLDLLTLVSYKNNTAEASGSYTKNVKLNQETFSMVR